ncbi:MAG: DNA mismatch repair protein MutS [Spirochaetes bacterium]|nr:DNA mismatch repair protein MutS [Spirochaetota bacterium]
MTDNNLKLTPMLRQYLDIKKKHAEAILFFRMGDFYEMFFEDAHAASAILDIALTKRQNDVPMCGIPYHAADSYISRLIKAGKKVAICEQLETVPSEGKIVKREVVRIITPGTVIESNLLQSDENNFLASVIIDDMNIAVSCIDISTGDFFISSFIKNIDTFRGEIAKFNPREIILKLNENEEDQLFSDCIKNRNIYINRINNWLYDREYLENTIKDVFSLQSIKSLELNTDLEIIAAGSILEYLKDAHKRSFSHLKFPKKLNSSDRMILDEATINNLELVYNSRNNTRNYTLFSILNNCRTAMGKRFLEINILQPLINTADIENRLDIVQYFHEYHELISEIQTHLRNIPDIERIISRFNMDKYFPRDFIAFKNALNAVREIHKILAKQPDDKIRKISEKLPLMTKIHDIISKAITDEPAVSIEQGRVIREGYNSDLDRLYSLKSDAKDWMLSYQEEQKKKLEIPTLRVRYNKVHGYYIEISKGQVSKVPDYYLRKQTLVNAERYTTEELQNFETDILNSADKITEIEKNEVRKIVDAILEQKDKFQDLALTVAEIDFFISLASSALDNRYVRPEISGDGTVSIIEGRHPIVEKYFTEEIFIPNDINFDSDENIVKIVTGPNMAGKSTYIRMAAVIQLMAQIGSFVPAASAKLSIADRIFTRIGASDNISRGESTFLVEMNETATILNNATDKSLIIMDEVGRGTSTYDGLSLAWAIVEYILKFIKAKTMFATHYHELTKLSSQKGIINYTVLVKDNVNGVEFLHKVVKGSADKSYGIHVAALAGVPRTITDKAAKILNRLEKNKKSIDSDSDNDLNSQMELFNAANHRVIQALKGIDTDNMTPIDALNEINRLKNLIE